MLKKKLSKKDYNLKKNDIIMKRKILLYQKVFEVKLFSIKIWPLMNECYDICILDGSIL